MLFMLVLGGHALIEKQLASEHIPELLVSTPS